MSEPKQKSRKMSPVSQTVLFIADVGLVFVFARALYLGPAQVWEGVLAVTCLPIGLLILKPDLVGRFWGPGFGAEVGPPKSEFYPDSPVDVGAPVTDAGSETNKNK